MEYCEPCDRSFVTPRALEQHLESKHPYTYCSRCQRHFPHARAKQQHVADSSRHHICYICSHEPDFDDEDELAEHLAAKHHICAQCDRKFGSSTQLHQHDVVVHHECEDCGKRFKSESNLKNHQKTHAEKTIECFGCPRAFISDSAMVLHLEAGSCQSGADGRYVTEVAFECYQSRRYTSDDPDFDFQCPTCDTDFSFMSALLQHAESVAPCDEQLERNRPLGKFLHYLRISVREL